VKRLNSVMEHVLAARREALSMKVKRDRRRVVKKLQGVLEALALIERGWLQDGEEERAAKRRRYE
jgi:hypothetical protein